MGQSFLKSIRDAVLIQPGEFWVQQAVFAHPHGGKSSYPLNILWLQICYFNEFLEVLRKSVPLDGNMLYNRICMKGNQSGRRKNDLQNKKMDS